MRLSVLSREETLAARRTTTFTISLPPEMAGKVQKFVKKEERTRSDSSERHWDIFWGVRLHRFDKPEYPDISGFWLDEMDRHPPHYACDIIQECRQAYAEQENSYRFRRYV